MMAAFIRGKPRFTDYDPGATVVHAGDVIVIGKVPCIAHVDIPAFAGAKTLDALAIGGGIYEMTAAVGTYAIGTFVYWDSNAAKVTTASSNTTTPFGVIVGGAAHRLSDATGATVTVAHDPEAPAAMSLMAASGPDATKAAHESTHEAKHETRHSHR